MSAEAERERALVAWAAALARQAEAAAAAEDAARRLAETQQRAGGR
ncbi:hypothetical protein [Embleya sp. NPDC020886]